RETECVCLSSDRAKVCVCVCVCLRKEESVNSDVYRLGRHKFLVSICFRGAHVCVCVCVCLRACVRVRVLRVEVIVAPMYSESGYMFMYSRLKYLYTA